MFNKFSALMDIFNFDTADPFNLRPTNFFDESGDFDALPESADPKEIKEMKENMALLYYNIPDLDKIKVFMTSMKSPACGRHRKDITREIARLTNRPDKEIQGLDDQEKARLFIRKLAQLGIDYASLVMAIALATEYSRVANRLIKLCPDVDAVLQGFRQVRSEIPDSLWDYAIRMVTKSPDEKQQQAIDAIRAIVDRPTGGFKLPFSIGEFPPLSKIEIYLLDLHKKDAAEAKPLISSLSQINPNRPENWLLYGLAGMDSPPQTVHERAWWLAGRLYSWGEDLSRSDKPFPGAAIKDPEVVQAIYTDPKLAGAQKMIGEYLIRQLVLVNERSLLLDVLPSDMVRNYPRLLMKIVVREAVARATRKDLDHVRALIARFPDLKQQGILAVAFRRAGQFEAAAAELRNSKHEPPGERELVQARISNAFEIEIPEDPDAQSKLTDQLEPLNQTDDAENPEIGYCKALFGILCEDTYMAEEAYNCLEDLPDENMHVRAYRLLSSILSRNSDYIEEALSMVESSEAEELLAAMPTNLLKTGIRSLAIYRDPTNLTGLTDFIYAHDPELLDQLTGMEDWLLTNPSVRQRLMDKHQAGDSIQRWAGYQKVIELAAKCGDSNLQAQAVDGCLSLKDPLLAPHQAQLLQQQISICEDLDLREELIERLIEIRPDDAKPHLYQLLQTYMGKQHPQDASRIIEALNDLGEDSPDLRDCLRVLQPGQPAKSAPSNGRLPHPVSVGFYGGDENDKPRTEQLRGELMRAHPGLTIEFDCRGWNTKNLDQLVTSVAKFDVIVASNLMRTTVNRRIRERTRESGKTFGFCRNRGTGTITDSIIKAVNLHLAHEAANGNHKSAN
jgi:tetratricopeptide (TPR) repeat protein